MRGDETGGNLASKNTVLNAFSQNNQTGNNLIKQYVTAFDDNDGVCVGTVTAKDLNKFAQHYGLNDAQITKLVGLYSTTAKVERRRNTNSNDGIRDKIVAK